MFQVEGPAHKRTRVGVCLACPGDTQEAVRGRGGGGEVTDAPRVRSTVRSLGICFCVMSGVGLLLKDCEREGISSDLHIQVWL